MMIRKGLFIVFCFLVTACDLFEYSPNQAFDRDTPRDLNARNVERLLKSAPDDTITIAFVGDSQRFYDHIQAFVKKVNNFPEVDLVLLAGDISDFGLLNEFEWVHEKLSRLQAPYIAVIGNHDVIANGENVFRRMYGPLDFSFVYDSIKFVIHNTNGLEYPGKDVPDIGWLADELQQSEDPSIKHFITVSHVPPDHGDFKPHLVEPYSALLRDTPGLLVSLHGHVHNHNDGYPFNDGVRYITSFAFNQSSFVMLKIRGGNIVKEIITY
jgi:3',5'-cyclic-AMP phosphodiesterase